jgi:hypothetical protein
MIAKKDLQAFVAQRIAHRVPDPGVTSPNLVEGAWGVAPYATLAFFGLLSSSAGLSGYRSAESLGAYWWYGRAA